MWFSHTFTCSDILNNQQQNEQDQKTTIQTIIVGPYTYIYIYIYISILEHNQVNYIWESDQIC